MRLLNSNPIFDPTRSVDHSTGISVFYRLAEQPAAQPKAKPSWASKSTCLRNCIQTFGSSAVTVLGDRLGEALRDEVASHSGVRCIDLDEGSGGGSFRRAALMAMERAAEDVVYLCEDDFLHLPAAADAIRDGLSTGAQYVTLYDHPDKYVHRKAGGNRHVRRGGEATRLMLGRVTHWKITNSTVMTFATTAGQLRKDWRTFQKYCVGRYTDDYRIFRSLSWRGRRLVSAVPGLATHCETQFMSPLVDWSSIAKRFGGGG